jgi:parallel beta-helix repeat protein
LVILRAAILLAAAVPTSATTYSVCPDGTGDFTTIQAAIDAAADGDVIELCNGTFSGVGNRSIDYLGKAITVRSASGNPEACVIVCGGFTFGFYIHQGEGPSSVIEGLTITNGGNALGGAILIENSSPTIRNCRIVNSQARYIGAGLLLSGSSARVENCVIAGNDCGWEGGGVALFASSPTFEDCVLSGNRADELGGGIFLSQSSSLLLIGCTITGNHARQGGGINLGWEGTVEAERMILWGNCGTLAGADALVYDNSTLTFTCCDVDSSGVEGGGTITYGADNLFIDPLFCDPTDCNDAPTTAADYRLAANSPCLDAPGCGLIGALEQGCGAIPVEPSSWGWIKSLYR